MSRRRRTRIAVALVGAAASASAAWAEHFDYAALRKDPSPERVGSIIEQVARHGRQGHHFLLTYCTQDPGVALSPWIRSEHPAEITIVLEHRFWDLALVGDAIHVTVTFNRVPERLVIPLDALTYFSDPTEDLAVRLRNGETSEERCASGII